MSGEPEIALVLSADAWVDALHRFCADHGGARVRCLVLDPAVALDEDFDVLVTSDRWPALTRPFVEALHQRGRRVLMVGDAPAVDLAARVGVDRVVGAGTPLVEIITAVVEVAEVAGGAGSGTEGPEPSGVPGVASGEATGSDADGTDPGFVIVGGPRGAGSTEVALGLAARWVQAGTRPVVVDADAVTPSVAVRLGLPLEPNLCTAVDAVAFGVGAVPGALFDLGPDWPVVLVGPPNRRAGAALAGRDVAAVGAVLARRYAPVVVDVSTGPGDGPDDPWTALVARAGVVVGVGIGDPVGVVRLSEWIDAARAITSAPVVVAVNRAPTSRRRRAEIAADLQGGGQVHALTFVPADPRVEDAAWSASLVDRGPFARAVDEIRSTVAGAPRMRTAGAGVD